MTIADIFKGAMNAVAYATPGIQQAIEYNLAKKKLSLQQKDQAARERYTDFLISRMSPVAAENYFKNQTRRQQTLRELVSSLSETAAYEEIANPGTGKERLDNTFRFISDKIDDIDFLGNLKNASTKLFSRAIQDLPRRDLSTLRQWQSSFERDGLIPSERKDWNLSLPYPI